MPRRIDLSRAVLLIGAALLVVSLFVRWYDNGPNGWEVFEALDLVLAGLAIAAAVLALGEDEPPVAGTLGIPLAAVAVVVVQLVNDPPAAAGADPSTGAWLALAGALLMLAGAAFSFTRVSVTVVLGERPPRRVRAVDRRRRPDATAQPPAPAAAPPAVAAEPGPPAGPAADDLERTQPLSALPDDGEEGPVRP